MILHKVPIELTGSGTRYDIVIGSGLLADAGKWVATHAVGAKRIALVSNKKVFGLYGNAVARSLEDAGIETAVHLIGDGERYKNLRTVERTLDAFNLAGITRTDAVVALGGGVVGDLAGFASAVHLRGIRFLQVPTTLLAMIDSSVGGKTGVNSAYGKNLIGAFHQPSGVLIDVGVLATLPPREMVAGFCEAVKQGAVSGKKLFGRTAGFLSKNGYRFRGSSDRSVAELAGLIAAQVSFKAKVVSADEREEAGNRSRSSRKILNFGHTFAHALEQATDYRYLRHGEAVGHGILFAAELSKKLELLRPDVVNLLNGVVRDIGPLPALHGIDPDRVADAFQKDKKQIGDTLQWILLRDIGKPAIVPDSQIPRPIVRDTIRKFVYR